MKFLCALVSLTFVFSGFAAEPAARLDYRREGKNYLLVLRPGEKVVESLVAFMAKERLPGASFTAIGAVKNATVAYYDLGKHSYLPKTFAEPTEVLSLIGNLGTSEGRPIVHAHIVLGGADYAARGGHLKEAEVTVTLEVFITPMVHPIVRKGNPNFREVKTIDLGAE